MIGDGPEVLDICSGGFLLDSGFSPQRLHEVAKMDGAIILAVATAAASLPHQLHLVPDPSVPTVDDLGTCRRSCGTRHRARSGGAARRARA